LQQAKPHPPQRGGFKRAEFGHDRLRRGHRPWTPVLALACRTSSRVANATHWGQIGKTSRTGACCRRMLALIRRGLGVSWRMMRVSNHTRPRS
jgi:hypothetical protein